MVPVARNPDPVFTAADPMTVNPARVLIGRLHIGSGNPCVMVIIPTLIARLPNPARMFGRDGRSSFFRMWRRCDMNNDLGPGCERKRQYQATNGSENVLFHHHAPCVISVPHQ